MIFFFDLICPFDKKKTIKSAKLTKLSWKHIVTDLVQVKGTFNLSLTQKNFFLKHLFKAILLFSTIST